MPRTDTAYARADFDHQILEISLVSHLYPIGYRLGNLLGVSVKGEHQGISAVEVFL
ncbi:hypothetical protein DMR_09720 [Solidesulfovibrio magneticus RS-1]|uniref:Uncharacterized protein n=1 Tax=Solidesulfovibrio magneticus (strain ATCC 700980 / DSM 13731 / RS-1) TaxID=573370 RepID=C4XKS4_SOLM1|nr:hypothetical protein DMR_09720 [Solidesulfovibrio magneticus RS-1]